MKNRVYYKVLKQDMTNVGLLNAPLMKYFFCQWNRPMEQLSDHPRKGGGLWLAATLGIANKYRRYLLEKHGIVTRIFRCRIDNVLYNKSKERIKTDGVYFDIKDEIFIPLRKMRYQKNKRRI